MRAAVRQRWSRAMVRSFVAKRSLVNSFEGSALSCVVEDEEGEERRLRGIRWSYKGRSVRVGWQLASKRSYTKVEQRRTAWRSDKDGERLQV